MKIRLSKRNWEIIGEKVGWLKHSQYYQPQTPSTRYNLDTEKKILEFILNEVAPLAKNYSTRFEAIKKFREIPGKGYAGMEEMKKAIDHARDRMQKMNMWVAKNQKGIKK